MCNTKVQPKNIQDEAYAKDFADGDALGRALLREMAAKDQSFRLGDQVARLICRPLTELEEAFFAVIARSAIDSARSRYPAP